MGHTLIAMQILGGMVCIWTQILVSCLWDYHEGPDKVPIKHTDLLVSAPQVFSLFFVCSCSYFPSWVCRHAFLNFSFSTMLTWANGHKLHDSFFLQNRSGSEVPWSRKVKMPAFYSFWSTVRLGCITSLLAYEVYSCDFIFWIVCARVYCASVAFQSLWYPPIYHQTVSLFTYTSVAFGCK